LTLKAPEKFRENILQMYLKGHKNYKKNLNALLNNQNNVEKAVKAIQPSEFEKLTDDLEAMLKKIGAPAIKNV
jgi:hypothetical protein